MKDLKIGRKLALIFVAIGVLFALLSISAHYQMRKLGNEVRMITKDTVPMLVHGAAINTATSDYEVAILGLLLSRSEAARTASAKKIAQQLAIVERETAALKTIGLIDEEPIIFGAFEEKWRRYRAAAAQVMAKAESGDIEGANLLLGNTQPLFDSLSSDIARFNAYQQKQAEQAHDNSQDIEMASLAFSVILALAALGGLSAALAVLIRSVAQPLSRVTQAIASLAAGNLAASIPVEARADEVGDLAQATVRLRDQLSQAEQAKQAQVDLVVSRIGTALDRLSRGDLTSRITASLDGPFAKIAQDFNAAVASLQSTVQAVSGSAEGIHTGSSEIRAASDDLASRTQQQAAALEKTAAAMSEVTGMVQRTARSAGEVNISIDEAHGEASKGGDVVRRAIAAMGAIEKSSEEVAQIINVIDGISFQTNLLALNAGVEAARAGDSGRGFAVVANEVRALAQRSADAAKDIKELIGASSQQVSVGVALVTETGTVLEGIVKRVGAISSLITSIATSAEAQATSLVDVNGAVGEMDRMTQQNAAMVEQSTAAARGLAGEADELAALVGRFRVGEGNALRRAAPSPKPAARAPAPVQHAPVHRSPPIPAPAKAAPALSHGNLALADDWSEF